MQKHGDESPKLRNGAGQHSARRNENPKSQELIENMPKSTKKKAKPSRSAGAGRKIVPLAVMEKQAIVNALQVTNDDKLKAARLLGIGKTTLYRKLKEYGW